MHCLLGRCADDLDLGFMEMPAKQEANAIPEFGSNARPLAGIEPFERMVEDGQRHSGLNSLKFLNRNVQASPPDPEFFVIVVVLAE